MSKDGDPNDLLTDARCAVRAPSGSGEEMSRHELAEAINAYLWATYKIVDKVDATYIGHLEQGRHRWPNVKRREALRHVLGVRTDTELGFYYRQRGPIPQHGPRSRAGASASRAAPPVETPWYAPRELVESAVAGGDLISGGDLATAHVRRRSLLVGMATVAASLLAAAGGSRRRRIGSTDIMQLNALTSLYGSMDYEFGGGDLVGDVGRFAESASGLLDHEVPDTVLPQLLTAVANARYLAAWTAFDATWHIDAQRHFIAAERYALDAGDRLLLAHVRYGQARQLQHLRHNRDALHTLRTAYDRLRPTPGMLTTLRGAEAASLAALGDSEAARRALGEASDAFTSITAGSEPEWMSFLDEGELFAQYGRAYRDMARVEVSDSHGETAVRWVTDAIRSFGPRNVRSAVLNQVGLSSAYFLAGAPELAVQAGRIAQQQTGALTSPRVVERIANLRRDALPHADHPEVAAFLRTLPRQTKTAA